MQETLTFVKRTTTDKAGKTLTGKNGKPYTRLSIKTKEHGEQWLSGFDSKDTAQWSEGQQVEIEVTEVEKDGKKYLNFVTPKKGGDELLKQIFDNTEMILNRLVGLKIDIETIKAAQQPKKEYPPNDGEVPFEEEPDF